MSDNSARCPLCGEASRPFLTAGDRNREITAERFHYSRCGTCESVFMVDAPADLARYYAGPYHAFDADGAPEWTRNPALQEVERHRVELLRRHVSPGPLVDVGAGPGGFAAAAHRAGFDVTAIEMDKRCCDYMEAGLGIRAICSDHPQRLLAEITGARVIALWHVLEHLSDPAAILTGAVRSLEAGGVLALGVPNPQSLQFRLLRGRWAHLDAPRHLCLMPERAIAGYLEPQDMRLIAATTDDPFGRICDLHGWTYALRRRPARGQTGAGVIRVARLVTALMSPLERSDRRGTALTLLFRKAP
jgi:SAM-dependent methyltransferase